MKSAVQELGDRYTRLASALLDAQLEEFILNARGTGDSYDALAVVVRFPLLYLLMHPLICSTKSTLFALLQLGLMQYMGEPHFRAPIVAALEAFSLLSVSLTAFGTAFAVVHSRTLKFHTRTAERILKAKLHRSMALRSILQTRGVFFKSASLVNLTLDEFLATLPGLTRKCQDNLEELQRLQYIINHHLGPNYMVLIAIPLGVFSFVVSLFVFTLASGHLVVGILLLVLVIFFILSFFQRALHHHPDIWKEVPLVSGYVMRRRER